MALAVSRKPNHTLGQSNRPRSKANSKASTAATEAASFTVNTPLYKPKKTASINTNTGAASRKANHFSAVATGSLKGANSGLSRTTKAMANRFTSKANSAGTMAA